MTESQKELLREGIINSLNLNDCELSSSQCDLVIGRVRAAVDYSLNKNQDD
jgi:hypothetical protein